MLNTYDMEDYFKKILQSEVYEVAKKTPLEKANNLSKTLNNNIYLIYQFRGSTYQLI